MKAIRVFELLEDYSNPNWPYHGPIPAGLYVLEHVYGTGYNYRYFGDKVWDTETFIAAVPTTPELTEEDLLGMVKAGTIRIIHQEGGL